MKVFKKILSILIVLLLVISTIIMPVNENYQVEATTADMSLETFQYISAFLLVAGGLIYTDTEQFISDTMALADHLYQSALLESEQWTGQAPTKTKGFEWKLYINENYKEEPNPNPQKPNEPKKYYIPIDKGLYEIAKAWIMAHIASNFIADPVSVTGLQPISTLGTVDLPVYNYDTADSIITFYAPNGKMIGKTIEYSTWPLCLIKVPDEWDEFPGDWYYQLNGANFPYDPDTYTTIFKIDDLTPTWYDSNHFTLVDSPSYVMTNGPYYQYFTEGYRKWNPFFRTDQIAYWKIENNYVAMTNYNTVEINTHGQTAAMYDPTYDWSAADGKMYVPVEPMFIAGQPMVYPDGLPEPSDGIGAAINSTLEDLENLDIDPLVDGEPYKFNPELEEWRQNNPDPGGDSGTDPDPDPDPFPFPEPGQLPDPDTDLTPDPEPGGTVGEFILSIPILGDIYRVLLAIYRGVLFIGNWLSDFEFPTITIPPITFPQFPAIPTVAEIVAAIKEMILSVFIPDENYLATKFEPVIETFETKFGYDLGFLYSVQSAAARRPQNIEIDYMGSHGTIVSFDDLDDTLLIIRPWIQSLIYFMLMIYHVNNIYKMIRGTSLIELKMNEIQIHNTMNEGGFR